jgi:mono/diheme cytochrome c family protein
MFLDLRYSVFTTGSKKDVLICKKKSRWILTFANDKEHGMDLRLVLLIIVMLTGCTGASGVQAVKAEVLPNSGKHHYPPATSSPTPTFKRFSRGQVLYLQHCADCHGWEGQGDGPLATVLVSKPPALRQEIGVFAHNTDAQIVSRILSGTPFRTIQFGSPPYTDDEITSLVTYLQQLPVRNWNEIRRGKDEYDSLCAACHGLYGHGDGLGAQSFTVPVTDIATPGYQQSRTDDMLIRTVTEGTGIMPGAGDVLTPFEIRAVVSYLRILSPGYELYSRFCAYCHGTEGTPVQTQPATASDTATAPFPPRFDEAYFRTHNIDQIRRAVPHLHRKPRPTMPHLARQLSADDALEIVRYLRTLAASQ